MTRTTDSFRAEKPRQWSPVLVPARGPNRTFDLHPDGQRIAVAPAAETENEVTHVILIFNFFNDLRRLTPAGSSSDVRS